MLNLNDAHQSRRFIGPASAGIQGSQIALFKAGAACDDAGWLTLSEWKTTENINDINTDALVSAHGWRDTPVQQWNSLAIVAKIARPKRDRLMTETAALALEVASRRLRDSSYPLLQSIYRRYPS
jgi:hypothetical protein